MYAQHELADITDALLMRLSRKRVDCAQHSCARTRGDAQTFELLWRECGIYEAMLDATDMLMEAAA